ncbi:MAG: copper resistance protein NlpE [Ferruginibacter sp.]
MIIWLTSVLVISCNQANENSAGATKPDDGIKAFDDDTVSASPAEPIRKSATEVQATDTGHTAGQSIDWTGTYAGKLPCADCQGIQTELKLTADKTYQLAQTYLGKSAKPVLHEGTFTWRNGTNIQLLENGQILQQFLVAVDKLYQLDEKGRIIKGKLAKQYILKKS